MRYCTQIFKRVALFLKRIIGRAFAQNRYFLCVNFNRVLRHGGFNYGTRHLKRGAELHKIRNVAELRLIDNDLQML